MKNKVLFRYMATYFIIFVIPLLIIAIVVNYSVMTNYKQELLDKNQQAAVISNTSVNSEFSRLSSIAFELSRNPNFTPFRFANTPLQANRIISILNTYTVTSTIADRMFLSFPSDEYIYTDSTSAHYSLFFSHLEPYTNYTPEAMRELLHDMETKLVIPASQSVNHNITVLIPLKYSDNRSKFAVVGFVISSNKISEILQDDQYDFFYIVTAGDEIIYSSPAKNQLDPRKVVDSTSVNGSTGIAQVLGRLYNVNYQYEPSTGLSYYRYTLDDVMFQSFNSAITILVVSVILSLLLGVLISVAASMTSIKPLANFYRYLNDTLEVNDNTESDFTDFKDLYCAVDNIFGERTALIEKLNCTHPILENDFLDKLLRGYITEAQFDSKADELGFPRGKSRYCCGVLLCDKPFGTVSEIVEITDMIKRYSSAQVVLLHQVHIDMDKIIVIAYSDCSSTQIYDFLRQLHAELIDKLCLRLRLSIGNICHNPSNIRTSYSEALLALDRIYAKGNNGFILYKSVETDLSDVALQTNRYMKMIYGAIEKNNITLLHDILGKYTEFVRNSHVPLYISKALGFNLLNGIYNALLESETVVSRSRISSSIFSLIQAENFDDLANQIMHFFSDIDFTPVQSASNEPDSLLSSMLEYLSVNFNDANFSIQMFADHFGMSASRICQYFNLYTGKTILLFVTELRMERAYQLLETTQQSVQEISEQIGYLNTSSFTRRFKQVTGVTPNSYRNLHKKRK